MVGVGGGELLEEDGGSVVQAPLFVGIGNGVAVLGAFNGGFRVVGDDRREVGKGAASGLR